MLARGCRVRPANGYPVVAPRVRELANKEEPAGQEIEYAHPKLALAELVGAAPPEQRAEEKVRPCRRLRGAPPVPSPARSPLATDVDVIVNGNHPLVGIIPAPPGSM